MSKRNIDQIIQEGVIAYNEERFEDAEVIFKKAIKLKPDHADAYNNLATLLQKKKNMMKQRKTIKKRLH